MKLCITLRCECGATIELESDRNEEALVSYANALLVQHRAFCSLYQAHTMVHTSFSTTPFDETKDLHRLAQ